MRSRLALALISLATAGPATVPVSAAAGAEATKATTKVATCDELPGLTFARNDRWRVFAPAARGGGVELSSATGIFACARSTGPSREVLALGSWGPSAVLAGDVVRLTLSGSSDFWSVLVDLSNRRIVGAGGTQPAEPSSILLPNGALVHLPFRAPDPSSTDQPMAVSDANGRRTFDPSAAFLATFGDARRSGFYVLNADGSVQRELPQGPASLEGLRAVRPDSAQVRTVRYVRRIRPTPGVVTTYRDTLEIRSRRARAGRRASLTVHRLSEASRGRDDPRSEDLVARLAPGSLADLQVIPRVGIAGRFADRPGERQLRIGKRVLPLSGPITPEAYGTGFDTDVVVREAGQVTLLARSPSTGRFDRRVLPIPPDAQDFATVPVPGSPTAGPGMQRWVLYTDAAGVSHTFTYAAGA